MKAFRLLGHIGGRLRTRGLATSAVAWIAAGQMSAQVAVVHQMGRITPGEDGTVAVTLTGSASAGFKSYFDLFPIERSRDLKAWFPLATLTRTNALGGDLEFVDDAMGEGRGFYRTPTNILATPLPPLAGPYPVGTFSRLLTDPARTNLVRHTNQQFMVTFWHPAAPAAGSLPGAYVDAKLIARLNSFYGFSVSPAFVGHAWPNAPLATNGSAWPVVLYSPSANSHRRENIYKVEELASHGFVVVGMDHRDTFMSVFPDGKLVSGQAIKEPTDGASLSTLMTPLLDRVADAQVTLDEVARMNAEDPEWAGRLDLDRIGVLGFSIGGATAAQLCKLEPRCRAGLGMDGLFIDPQLLATPLDKPFLFLRSDTAEVNLPNGPPDDRLPIIEAMIHDGYFIQISGTVHWSYSDVPLLASPAAFRAGFGSPRHPVLTGARVNQITAAYVLAFFRKYLRGTDDHLLDGPPPEFPEVLKYVKR